jgi:DNA-binding transcriptional regulator YhcF (GntR family)
MPQRRDDIPNLLRQRVVAGLHLGLLRPGMRLPSVRTLAAEFEADLRVVLAGYRQLESDGLVELRPRSGVFVADTAVSASETLPQTAEWVVEVLVQALRRGVPAVEFPERVRGCLETVRLRATCIECNDDQIAGLCRELEQDYGFTTSSVDLDTLRSAPVPSGLRDADLLVSTSHHAAEVQRLAERLDKPWIAVSLRPEFIAETSRLLRQGPLYFVATDSRFATKIAQMFASEAGIDNLHVLILGRDDVSIIPSDAPTYLMPAARARLQNVSLLARVIPAPRVFSPDSARALLAFIVSANVAAIRKQGASRTETASGT